MDFSGLDKVVKCFHGLFRRYGGVVSMDLKKIDVVCSETLERGINGFENRAT